MTLVPHPRVTFRWAREELGEIWAETLEEARDAWSEAFPDDSDAREELEYDAWWLRALWRYLRD